MNWIDYLGLLGVVTGSLTFVPQVYKAWISKSVGDLSIWTVLILISNVSIWLVYGIVKDDFAMELANSIILALAFVMLYFKLTFKK
jgi:MtN3 and saliva related transmembrane protein